jgi:hypothetical protein
MSRHWFKPKGAFGASPTTWEGVLSTLIALGALVAAPQLAIHFIPDLRTARFVILGAMFLILAAFIGLCAWKTEGGLRWRRGGRN